MRIGFRIGNYLKLKIVLIDFGHIEHLVHSYATNHKFQTRRSLKNIPSRFVIESQTDSSSRSDSMISDAQTHSNRKMKNPRHLIIRELHFKRKTILRSVNQGYQSRIPSECPTES